MQIIVDHPSLSERCKWANGRLHCRNALFLDVCMMCIVKMSAHGHSVSWDCRRQCEELALCYCEQESLPEDPLYWPESAVVGYLDIPLGQGAEKVLIWLPWRTWCEE